MQPAWCSFNKDWWSGFRTYAWNTGLPGSLWSTCTYSYQYICLHFDRADGIYLEIKTTKTMVSVPCTYWRCVWEACLVPKTLIRCWCKSAHYGSLKKTLLQVYASSLYAFFCFENMTIICTAKAHASMQLLPRFVPLGLRRVPCATGQYCLPVSSPFMGEAAVSRLCVREEWHPYPAGTSRRKPGGIWERF